MEEKKEVVLTDAEKWVFGQLTDFFRPFNTWLDGLPQEVWHLAAVGLFVGTALLLLLFQGGTSWVGRPIRRVGVISAGGRRWRSRRTRSSITSCGEVARV